MSARRRSAKNQSTDVVSKDLTASLSSEIRSMPDTNDGLLIVRRVFNYLLLIGGVAGLLYVYYTYFLFDAPAIASMDVDELKQPFAVVDLPGKGKGAIAIRNITRGERILYEEPLFVVPNRVHTSPGAVLLSKLSLLTPRQRQKYYNLSYVHMPTDLEPRSVEYNEAFALAIFQTNSISAGSDSGIFPRTARLNHGCSKAFNAVYTWRESEGALVVHALKNIEAGEELLTTYTDTKKPRSQRRQYLQSLYDFECDCSVCTLPDELSQASDVRLVKMTELNSQFARWGNNEISGREATAIAREIWALGDEEGYWSERGQLAADALWVAASHSDTQATVSWAETAREWYGYELGRDSAQVGEMAKIVAHPMNHRMWGLRRHETVHGPLS